MNRVFKAVSVGLLLAAAPVALTVPAAPAMAQATDPAVAQIQGFYDVLVATMKMGGTAKARYDKLKPAIEKAFDLEGMTAIVIGPGWATMADADKKALTDAFSRWIIANYAKNFDSYGGEKFPVDPAIVVRGSDHYVKSKLVGGETHAFNYRMHQVGAEWKVTDVLLDGNISQMAQKRSDFASTLASAGPQGLAKRIDAITDQMLS